MVRITQSLIGGRTLFNLQNNLNRAANLQDQLSSGRRINRPSDDPIDFPFTLSQRSVINLGQSHLRNINNARSNLDLSEASMNSVTEVLQNIRTLAVQGANETNDIEARSAIATQVQELFNEVVNLANSNFNGRYIFGGSTTNQPPFIERDGVIVYQGDDFQQQVTISRDATITSNVHGLESFMHTPNQITASLEVNDIRKPLAQVLREQHPQFPALPPLPGTQPGSNLEGSPNPNNSPSALPNNNADFTINGTVIRVDLSVDSLEDIKNRINHNVEDVTASIDERNRLVITSLRSDALNLQDGRRDTGFSPQPPQGSNLLTALGLNSTVESRRSLNLGFPALDPLTDGSALPTPDRAAVRVQGDSFLFVNSNTGPATAKAIPFADTLALTDIDADGNERIDADDNPIFIDELEAIRVRIDDETFDIDLRALTQGSDPDGIPGNEDDIPGSDMQDFLDLFNNHPQLQGRATAFINADGTGINIAASGSTERFEVSSVRKLFGADITTRVAIDPVSGRQTITRIPPLETSTKLREIPGALVDGSTGDSLGIRTGDPLPGIETPATNLGIVSVSNNGEVFSIDLREAETLGDVLRAFNESPAGIKAEINESKTGIDIVPLIEHDGTLSIMDVDQGTTARDLGLFAPPPPARISSTAALALTPTTLVTDVVPSASDGEFTIEVRDRGGNTLERFTIPVSATDTLSDLVERIDAADGVSGPGGGLISANLSGGTLNIANHFNGQTLFIDPSNDTTGTTAGSRLTQVLEIDRMTAVPFNNEPASIYASEQRTAEILGISAQGTLNEVEEANIFRTLEKLTTGLRQNNTAMIQDSLGNLDQDLERVLSARTSIGSRLNRLDNTQVRLEEAEALIRQQLSFIEDADLAELISELSAVENAFNASLQAASRVIQQSLINFLS